MSEPGQAVFLSYASQDAEAARRLCEALRAAGVEVWFDQNELVGGDAWDAKIRRQIQQCALFVPILSAATQARREGYFRLEWRLAAQRTHTMADGTPFLLPLVIDDTRDRDALVPEEFRAVQWTRLTDALAPAPFVERVTRLLDAAPGPAPTNRASPPEHGPPRLSGSRDTPAQSFRMPRWAAAAVLLLTAGVVALFSLRPAASAPRSAAKSVAVLPFANLSEDKDANAFFSDGIHEDILTHLALIRELTVVSRTSVMEYRDARKKIRQIAEELGVTYVLEGSVRRAGSTVRVTGQLIDARTDEHLWAGSFDRDLTAAGVFAIQSELAKAIAAALRAKLSPEEKGLLAQIPTTNLAAYEAYLKGTQARSTTALSHYEEAVRLDPNFAVAWARLSWAHGFRYLNRIDPSPERAEKARTAIETAVRIAPDHPEVIVLLGRYYYSVFKDYPRALEQYERAMRLQPNNPEVWRGIGAVHRRAGRWSEAIPILRKAVALDPASRGHREALVDTLDATRLYEQARIEMRALALRTPDARDKLRAGFDAAAVSFRSSGSTGEMETFLAQLTAEEAASPAGVDAKKTWAFWRGDAVQYLALDRISPAQSVREQIEVALVLAAKGEGALARARLPEVAELRSLVEQQPGNPEAWRRLGLVEALRGNAAEGVACARRAVELYPTSLDAYAGPNYRHNLAVVLAWTGDTDGALAEFAELLRLPGGRVNVHIMRGAPSYAPLKGDPRFEALLNDPKNNAPLI